MFTSTYTLLCCNFFDLCSNIICSWIQALNCVTHLILSYILTYNLILFFWNYNHFVSCLLFSFTRVSGRYDPFILGPAGGGPEVGASPCFGAPPLFWVSPETARNIEKCDNYFFEKIRNLFLTLEDVPDSWDGDQEPKMVPMYSQWPYLSFAKRLGSIPSSNSEI